MQDYELLIEVHIAGDEPASVQVHRRHDLFKLFTLDGWSEEEIEHLADRIDSVGAGPVEIDPEPGSFERCFLYRRSFQIASRGQARKQKPQGT